MALSTNAAVTCFLLLTVFIVPAPAPASSCTSAFMQMDVLRKRARYINMGGKSGNKLDDNLMLMPRMNFTCSGHINGLLLGADIRWMTGTRNRYPEIQLWRNTGGDNYTRQASQEIRLNPGSFSPDGVLQYTLSTSLWFQSGDVLGVYQPPEQESVARLYYNWENGAPDSYWINGNPSTIQSPNRVQNRFLLLSPITDAENCVHGFLNPSDLRETTALLNIHSVVWTKKEQRLFPDITFTCNGVITKWIVGAFDAVPNNNDNTQLQIWRLNSSSFAYNKIGASLLASNESTYTNVYEYIPNPPLEVQEGDILGVYQPDSATNQLRLYYQAETGPLNYLESGIIHPPPPSWFDSDTPATQLYYPLVTVEYSITSDYPTATHDAPTVKESIDININVNVMSTEEPLISTTNTLQSSTAAVATSTVTEPIASSTAVTSIVTSSIASDIATVATPIVTKAKASVVQESSVASLTPPVTTNEQPSNNIGFNIIIIAVFAALVLLVAVTIILMMMVMLMRRYCCRSRKRERSVGPSNSFRFAAIPAGGMVNGTFNQPPVPVVTNYAPVVRPESLSTNYEDMTYPYYDSVDEGSLPDVEQVYISRHHGIPLRHNTSYAAHFRGAQNRRTTLNPPVRSHHRSLPTTAVVNNGYIVRMVGNTAYRAANNNQ